MEERFNRFLYDITGEVRGSFKYIGMDNGFRQIGKHLFKCITCGEELGSGNDLKKIKNDR